MRSTPKEISEIQNARGGISTNFASIEYFIAQFITTHYFNGPNETFLAEVFEDEYFSFGLLAKIFDKVLQQYPEEYKKFPMQKLRRLQKLRNIIVHARLQSVVKLDRGGERIQEIGETYFHHAGKDQKVVDVFREYEKLRVVVQPAVVGLPGVSEQIERVELLRSDSTQNDALESG
ncbi:MAG: hypothetical protein KAS07_00875 [Candidatus Pacebacteria bacterium]|nr:hypothetical protein [Candidatus Paceibacterota bacterium]